MTEREKKSIICIMKNLSKTSDNENLQSLFNKEFPDAKRMPDYGVKLIEEALVEQNGENIYYSLFIAPYFRSFEERDISILMQILQSNLHENHEDIVQIFEQLKSPKTIECLYEVAQQQFDYYINEDDYPLARRCIWALWKIGTPEAIDKIKNLTKFKDDVVNQYALHQLERLKEITTQRYSGTE